MILSAFFSGSETAFFALSKLEIKKLEKKKDKKSRRILKLIRSPRELLVLILLGNTIVNVAASSLAAVVAINLGKQVFSENAQYLSLVIEVIIMTILLLIFGEITPKLLAFSFATKYSGYSSFFLKYLRIILLPVIKLLAWISSLFSKKKQIRPPNDISQSDFKNIINSKKIKHSLEDKDKKIIKRIFRFSSIRVKEIMVPRVDIVAVEKKDGLQEIIKEITQSGYSRIPIYKKNIDNIIGFVYAKDIIIEPNTKSINNLLRPALFVTEKIKIQTLLNQLRSKKLQIAVVCDEYGGTSGIVTIEDILEELVGEIMDEYDNEMLPLKKINSKEYIISGRLTILEFNQEFLTSISQDEFSNIAEFLFKQFGKVPEKNDSFIYEDKIKFTIKKIKNNRIYSIKVNLIK